MERRREAGLDIPRAMKRDLIAMASKGESERAEIQRKLREAAAEELRKLADDIAMTMQTPGWKVVEAILWDAMGIHKLSTLAPGPELEATMLRFTTARDSLSRIYNLALKSEMGKKAVEESND